jgi:transcriptional regulator with XRE-family HTH domain
MWEHGKRPIKVSVLRRLARFYDVPDALFIDPPMTDEERLEVALADAVALEQEDWGSEPDLGLGAAGERAGERDRRLQ